MRKSRKKIVSNDRYRLQNPYAHLEELEELEDKGVPVEAVYFGSEELHAAREKLQNPHAFDDGEGGFVGILPSRSRHSDQEGLEEAAPIAMTGFPVGKKKKAGSYSNEEIESIVRDFHRYLWKNRESLWPGKDISNALDVLDLRKSLECFGYDYREMEGIESAVVASGRVEVEGIIDPCSKVVYISGQCPPEVKRFTAAHELAHAVLHEMTGAVHRDRASDGSKISRQPMEREADRFASCFLIPEKQLRRHFEARFGRVPFMLTEESAFALGLNIQKIEKLHAERGSLHILLADAKTYNGVSFLSLTEKFKVSKTAMAIRIRELGLVRQG